MKSNVITIVVAVALALTIRITLFEAFAIDGPSMEPTLQHGDRVVVAKYSYGLFLPWTKEALINWGGPNPGDVVIVHSPMDNEDIVKRVIAVGGDTIRFQDGNVIRNGKQVATTILGPCAHAEQREYDPTCTIYQEQIGELEYRTSRSRYSPPIDRRTVTVPKGHIYVLGDHRDRSNDSRNTLIGPVSNSRVKGKVEFVYMSWRPGSDWFFKRIRWSRVGSSIN